MHASTGGRYDVVLETGERVEASLRGRLKRQARTGDRVVVGDVVQVERGDDAGVTIEHVEPRHSQVVRRSGPGRHAKVVAANVDRVLVVVSAADPVTRPEVIDRLLVLAEADHLEACLVVNKIDLPGAEAVVERLRRMYEPLGYPVLALSASTGQGLQALRQTLSRGTSVLVGPSGVGKSSLLNALEPGLTLRTGAVSERDGRGRHTTVSARLLPVAAGGLVADTPGFAEAGVWGVESAELDRCFPEFDEARHACRFRGCSHLTEPGCAVLEATRGGTIDPSRYQSYRAIREELLALETDRPDRR